MSLFYWRLPCGYYNFTETFFITGIRTACWPLVFPRSRTVIFFSLSGEKGILKQTEIHLYEATYDIQQNGKYIKTNDLGFFKESVHLIKDDPIIVNVDELNSFETYENEEFEVEVYLVEPYKQAKQLSFNQELDNNIYQYVNILFDNLADFEEKINTKDIYGDLVNRDDSNC